MRIPKVPNFLCIFHLILRVSEHYTVDGDDDEVACVGNGVKHMALQPSVPKRRKLNKQES